MSWGFAFQGKPAAVKAAIERYSQNFDIPEEQRSFDNAKASAIATVEGCSDSEVVFVSASGSAYQTTGGKHCEVSLYVKPSPVVTLGPSMGQWAAST
jgi:hypothetical protein